MWPLQENVNYPSCGSINIAQKRWKTRLKSHVVWMVFRMEPGNGGIFSEGFNCSLYVNERWLHSQNTLFSKCLKIEIYPKFFPTTKPKLYLKSLDILTKHLQTSTNCRMPCNSKTHLESVVTRLRSYMARKLSGHAATELHMNIPHS